MTTAVVRSMRLKQRVEPDTEYGRELRARHGWRRFDGLVLRRHGGQSRLRSKIPDPRLESRVRLESERRAESLQRRVEGAASFENLSRQDQRTRIRRIQLTCLLRMHEGGGKVIVLFFDGRELSIQKRALR